MVVVEEQDCYYSDSDSDDEDVDRYVFLARQPAGRHAEEDDRDASSANDDDDDDGEDVDGTAGEEDSEGGVRKTKKRPLREILGDDGAPPLTKKARLQLIIAAPLAARMTPPSGSESSSSRAGESGSEGSHEKAAREHRAPSPREQGEAKNAVKKKRAVCGKRSRSHGGVADGDRDHVAAAAKIAGASSGAASGRFACSLCDRCFDSHQALGGHVLGHRKRTKIAIAAAAILDADDAGEASAAVEAAKSIAQANKKAEHCDEDVDRARHKTQRKVHGKGNGGGVREPVFAGIHGDANGNGGFDNKCNTIALSGHGFTDGSSGSDDGKSNIGTESPNLKVVGAGTCHEGANDNGGNVCRTRYKCKVCGAECSTGRALGGHMRKHRKRPQGGGGGGGGEERSPSPATDDDCQLPLAQLFRAETSLQRGYI